MTSGEAVKYKGTMPWMPSPRSPRTRVQVADQRRACRLRSPAAALLWQEDRLQWRLDTGIQQKTVKDDDDKCIWLLPFCLPFFTRIVWFSLDTFDCDSFEVVEN
jgi:hypothetical protein